MTAPSTAPVLRWVYLGIFEHIWAVLVEEGDELGGVKWEWQAADAAMGKARMGGMPLDAILLTAGKRG